MLLEPVACGLKPAVRLGAGGERLVRDVRLLVVDCRADALSALLQLGDVAWLDGADTVRISEILVCLSLPRT